MPSITFRLYRAQVFAPQGDLFLDFPGAENLLKNAIIEEPRLELKRRHYFIDQINEFDKNCFHFLMTRRKEVTIRDKTHQSFDVEDFPYINIIADVSNEIFLFELNSDFLKDPDNSAKNLGKILDNSEIAKTHQPEIEFLPLRNPTKFTELIRKSSRIRRFYFEARKPNPFDASEVKKMTQGLTQELNGQKTQSITKGVNIDKEKAELLAREAASTGDDAGATLKLPGERKFRRYSLGKINVDIEWAGDITNSVGRLMKQARERFNSVRQTPGD